jgi:hypothetical protein
MESLSDCVNSAEICKIIADMQRNVVEGRRVEVHMLASEHTTAKKLRGATLDKLLKVLWGMLGYAEKCSTEHFEEAYNKGAHKPLGGFKTAFVRLPEGMHFVCIFADFFSSASNGGATYLRCGIAPWGDFEARRTLANMSPAQLPEETHL